MSDLCHLTITGNLTRDPETKTIAGGRQVTEFTVAVSRWNRRDKQEETRFVRCSVWSTRLGERMQQHGQKGTKVVVVGDHNVRMYDGKVYEDLNVDSVEMVARRKGQQERTAGAPSGRDAPQSGATGAANLYNDDDVPF